MPKPVINCPARRLDSARGFSLLEMLVSVAIILLLMSAVFPFIFQVQKRFQGNQVVSESNQSARAAMEVMTQEIGQAGYNPQFTQNKTATAGIPTDGQPQCLHISDLSGISPGDWVSVDTGPNQEFVEIVSTSSAVTGPSVDINSNVPATCSPAPATPWIEAKFEFDHGPGYTTNPFSISSYKMPYASGILVRFDNNGNLDITTAPVLSTDQALKFYGDINQDGIINYVVYSISPMVPATTVCIPAVAPGVACAAANTYTLYNLYRSIKPVDFPSQPAPNTYIAPNNNIASPMVEKVLYNTANAAGPTGLPIFAYTSHQQIGTAPNVYTALGTIVITLCVAVNPKDIETNTVSWYTMATQIRPLNLQAAININNSNGGLYLPPTPASLPMTNPAGYYP